MTEEDSRRRIGWREEPLCLPGFCDCPASRHPGIQLVSAVAQEVEGVTYQSEGRCLVCSYSSPVCVHNCQTKLLGIENSVCMNMYDTGGMRFAVEKDLECSVRVEKHHISTSPSPNKFHNSNGWRRAIS